MKKLLASFLAAATVVSMTGCSSSSSEGKPYAGQELHVYNWGEYMGENLISNFEEKTGATVVVDYFDSNELSRVYINFCDPWPKKRWAKRRLTHTNFLNMYREILNPEGEIHFKTDNEGLFEFSLNEIASNNWILKNISLNLANSDFENVTTEYEDKFMSQGLKIFRCEAKSK